MDLLIQQETLLALVHAAAKVSPKTSPKPILTHLLLEATDSLTVTATDQELTYVSSVPAQIEISGAVVVPAQDLLKVVQSFPKSVSVHLQHVSPDHANPTKYQQRSFSPRSPRHVPQTRKSSGPTFYQQHSLHRRRKYEV